MKQLTFVGNTVYAWQSSVTSLDWNPHPKVLTFQSIFLLGSGCALYAGFFLRGCAQKHSPNNARTQMAVLAPNFMPPTYLNESEPQLLSILLDERNEHYY